MASWTIAPILGVPDVREATDWYCDTLGFRCPGGVFQGVHDPSGVYAIVQRGEVSIHLQIRRGEQPVRERESIETDVYVFVDDTDALFAEYEAKGVKVHHGPMRNPHSFGSPGGPGRVDHIGQVFRVDAAVQVLGVLRAVVGDCFFK